MTDMPVAVIEPKRRSLAALVPASLLRVPRGAHRLEMGQRFSRTMLATVPIILASTVAIGTLTAPAAEAAPVRKPAKQRATTPAPAAPIKKAVAATASAPSSYRVDAGDTVSSIAERFGLSTASVLALNGLGWKSVIYPGQTLKLSKAKSAVVAVDSTVKKYTIVAGDTVSSIASAHGVASKAVLSANGLNADSVIYAGSQLTIPSASGATIAATTVSSTAKKSTSSTHPTSYTLATGDTITSVATKFGVSVQAILAANDLGSSSVIYAGRQLTIPTASVTVAGDDVTLLSKEMRANARVIVDAGRSLGVSDYGIVVALATAMQESGLRNIDYGHLDSVGLFQQRPSQGWGTVAQIMDPARSAKQFYVGIGEGKNSIPGLLDIAGWQSMEVTDAAQAVQVSAFPKAYAQWESSARFWLAEIG